MKIVELTQGSSAWHAHRASHLNASDAPAMLGISPYKARSELLRETATGVSAEIDEATQRRFDDGHRYEALARPLAEEIVGEDLFPCVGTEGKYSASFDGLTLMSDTAFEHKSLNDALRAVMVEGCKGADLPEHYRVQMEQQCMVSGADSVLFMASKWNGDQLVEERHCWYYADLDLRARIVAGWEQFEADVSAFVPEASAAPAATGKAPETLPALAIQVTGMVTASNLAEFKASALAVLDGINRDLQTDEDFANAEKTVKWCHGVEERLEATKQAVLGQTADIDAVFRTMDEVSAETRRIRLELDKLVKAEKDNRKNEIVQKGVTAVRAHYDSINETLGEHRFQPPQSLTLDVAAAIRGKKSLTSMRDAVGAVVANLKIDASQRAERVRVNLAILAEHDQHASLFADRVALCASKAPEDMRNLVAARIGEFEKREADRLEQERDRIRAEEAEKLRQEQQAEAERVEREQAAAREAEAADAAAKAAGESTQSTSVTDERMASAIEHGMTGVDYSTGGSATAATPVTHSQAAPRLVERVVAAVQSDARIKLGDINVRIAPLAITADGLAQLGFQSVGNERAAKLYRESDFPLICANLAARLTAAAEEQLAA
ncbi:lambda-exonuclease family protein [Luteimonas fraxinea]|uniref:YqaJ viral recombinase family protein n=1 Tax=Luteimonas fraxinea TaxID=2901869 RepID=A0ABS8U9G8_9GAMM|nr:YqaJ viral recombinase family protein [Luteimonas fraxinea]MCD9096150.1 YqaJ viral recombinase family protein [Luteimonas fraxinea]